LFLIILMFVPITLVFGYRSRMPLTEYPGGSAFGDWQTLAERAPVALSLLDGDGSPHWCNRAFERLFGLTENVPWTLAELVHDGESERLRHLLSRLVRGEMSAADLTARLRRHDGSTLDGRVLFEALPDRATVATTVVELQTPMVHHDPSGYRAAFADQHRLVCEWDERGVIVYCNREYRRLFGLGTAGHAEGEVARHLGQERGADILALLRDDLKAHTSLRRHDHDVLVEWCDTAVVDTDGAMVSVLSVGFEVTERVHVEQALRRTQRRFELMASQVDDSVMLVSPDGSILEVVGRPVAGGDPPPSEQARTNLFELIHPDDVAGVVTCAAAVDPHRAVRAEVRLRQADDHWLPVELDILNRLDEPDLGALMITVRDVERRRLIQGELDRCTADAAEADRQRVAFVANVSRELRNPLHAILSTSELMTNSGLPATSAMLAEAIFRRAQSLQRAVDDLLEFQQLRLGAIPVVRQDVDLVELVDTAITAARVHLFPGVTITARHDARVPRTISSDRVRLANVMVHLISNACKNTTRGSITVAVMQATADAHVRIEVIDTGHGIDAADLDRLFAPYERGHSDHPVGGLGLGLPIARGLVDALGGTLGVSSRPGFGSVFWVELPRAPSADLSPPHDSALRVLVVEDDPVNRMITARQLERLGASAEVVADGETALLRLEAEQFDLIVLDIQLPGISGLEVARRCRRAFPRPYVAGISTASTAADRAACFEAGMETFIPKPATLDSIRPVLESTDHHRAQHR
jgi:PAS domain S-box-containing protein